MPEQSSSEEKRRYPRYDLRLPVHYRFMKDGEHFGTTSTRDVSIAGLCMILDEFIAPKTPIRLNINFFSRIIETAGEVIWSANMAHSDMYKLGVQFTGLEVKNKELISAVIDTRTS